jgi:spermidine synthase
MGATFPILAKFYTKEKIGKGIGEIYAANNLGAIIGSFTAGFILIPIFGIKYSIIIAGLINLIIACSILVITNKNLAKKIIPTVVVIFLLLAYFGNYNIQQMHSGGFYRTNNIQESLGDVIYYEEGLYATVTVRKLLGTGKALFINGKGQGSNEITDLRVNFLLAYLPKLIHPEAENALVIGLGTGTTSGQLAQSVKTTTVEIEPKILGASPYFRTFNLEILENENHNLIIDDGRNYLLKNKDKYDIIIPEPSDPWQSFSSSLFSHEFLELASKNLNENGLYLQWVPIYQMSPEDFKNFYKTFSSVFPDNVAFANIKPTENTPVRFETSEIILIGSKQKVDVSEESFKENYQSLPSVSKQGLNNLRLSSGEEIYNLLIFTDKQMDGYVNGADSITDDNLLLEFSTAKNVLNQNPSGVINDIEEFIQK